MIVVMMKMRKIVMNISIPYDMEKLSDASFFHFGKLQNNKWEYAQQR